MDTHEQLFNLLYEQNLTNFTLQGKSLSTIDTYSFAVQRITAYFNCCLDNYDIMSTQIFIFCFSSLSEQVLRKGLNHLQHHLTLCT